MTSEQNVPEVESHQGSTMSPGQQDGEAQFTPQNVQHGMGQSKSSRRRRRKRKNKGSADAPQSAQSGGQCPARCRPFRVQPRLRHRSHRASRLGRSAAEHSSGGGKRWKKKFRDRDRQRSPENPGNVASGSNSGGFSNNGGGYRDRDTHQPGNNSGGFKRKGGGRQAAARPTQLRRSHGPQLSRRQRQLRRHSALHHRVARTATTGRSNGHGGGRSYQSDSQPIDYSQGRPIPIPEDAPTKIFFFIEDLFFIAKIQETARKLGVKVAFVKNEKEAIAALTGPARKRIVRASSSSTSTTRTPSR